MAQYTSDNHNEKAPGYYPQPEMLMRHRLHLIEDALRGLSKFSIIDPAPTQSETKQAYTHVPSGVMEPLSPVDQLRQNVNSIAIPGEDTLTEQDLSNV